MRKTLMALPAKQDRYRAHHLRNTQAFTQLSLGTHTNVTEFIGLNAEGSVAQYSATTCDPALIITLLGDSIKYLLINM